MSALKANWAPEQIAALDALRNWTVAFAELNQQMSRWLDLPTSDANALGQIVWAVQSTDPLSPLRLGRRIGMTSGATTVLINRLEAAGLILRTHEHADRRRVTLRPTEQALDRAEAFAAASSIELGRALDDSRPSDLAVVARVVRTMTESVTVANERLSVTVPDYDPQATQDG